MKKAVPLLALALGACSHKPPDPTVQISVVGFALQLPSGMQRALNAAMPGFHTVTPDKFRADVSQQSALASGKLDPLFATIGDFDGDGSRDAIVEGTVPDDSALHVVAIMNGAAPRAFPVMSIPVYDADAVGVYLTEAPGNETNAFEVVDYPDASYLYTYRGGTFVASKVGS